MKKNIMFLAACSLAFFMLSSCSENTPATDEPEDNGSQTPDSGDDNSGEEGNLPDYGTPDRTKIKAFPGAYGAGAYTTGGAEGKVLVVNSLKDDGSEGTLRWAINQTGKRTIVFSIGGLIQLESELDVRNGDVTIAGQTAPGTGICLKGHPVSIKTDNVIIRFIRCRMGSENLTETEADGAGVRMNVRHSMIIPTLRCSGV